MSRVTVKRSDSGNWIVRCGGEKTDIYPPGMWHLAFRSARETVERMTRCTK